MCFVGFIFCNIINIYHVALHHLFEEITSDFESDTINTSIV